jgi:hypothetical protein
MATAFEWDITMRGPWPLFLDGPGPGQSPVPTCYNARS